MSALPEMQGACPNIPAPAPNEDPRIPTEAEYKPSRMLRMGQWMVGVCNDFLPEKIHDASYALINVHFVHALHKRVPYLFEEALELLPQKPNRRAIRLGPSLARQFAMMGAITSGDEATFQANRAGEGDSHAEFSVYEDLREREVGHTLVFRFADGVVSVAPTEHLDSGVQSVTEFAGSHEVRALMPDFFPVGSVHTHPGKGRDEDMTSNYYAQDAFMEAGVAVKRVQKRKRVRMKKRAATALRRNERQEELAKRLLQMQGQRLIAFPSVGDVGSFAQDHESFDVVVRPPIEGDVATPGILFALIPITSVIQEETKKLAVDGGEPTQEEVTAYTESLEALELQKADIQLRASISGLRRRGNKERQLQRAFLRSSRFMADFYRQYGYQMYIGFYEQGKIPDTGIKLHRVKRVRKKRKAKN